MPSKLREINIGKCLRTTISPEHEIMNALSRNQLVGINHSCIKGIQSQRLYKLMIHPSDFDRVRKVGHKSLSLTGVL